MNCASRSLATVQRLVLCLVCWAACVQLALAHEGQPLAPHDLLTAWADDPLIWMSLALSAFLYGRGLWRLWRAVGAGVVIRKGEAAAFAGGWLALFVALASPLHPLGEVLFSAHMTQHEVLMLIAAPLLVLGRPLLPCLWALPLNQRRRFGRVVRNERAQRVWQAVTNPLAAWAIHAAALWLWHAPVLFQATLKSDFVHTLQHVSFLGSALLFWWALIHGRRGLMGYGAAVLYVFTTATHSGVLGALLTFATKLWYPAYAPSTAAWGLTPLEDQQLGGLVMWVPAGLLYLIAGLALFAGWLRESERHAMKGEVENLLERTR